MVNIDIEMIFVQGGAFTMGRKGKSAGDAAPAHQVVLDDFYIGKYEVTQAQWTAVTGYNPSSFKGDTMPVECVDWDKVWKFISQLNALTGKGYRLPTEAEWEYAAQGGASSHKYKHSSSNSSSNRYSGSNNQDEVAWYEANAEHKTHSVGEKQPNELGIYDMSGNVYEWCQDWYGNYSSGSQTNPQGLSTGSKRVVRGGSFISKERDLRVLHRHAVVPTLRNRSLGFRLACSSKLFEAKESKQQVLAKGEGKTIV